MGACSINVGGSILELRQGDITLEAVDAIVNAANTGLRGGGGVDGAIHRAGGPAIMTECRAIGGCETGKSVITTAGRLHAKYVIHTPGPVWRGGGRGEAELLASCYSTAMKIAYEHEVGSISFPSISTGIYGYPVEKAAEIALRAVFEGLQEYVSIKLARFVLFDSVTYCAYEKGLGLLID
ncbi:MAG: O-acetyl-ADP-ribose deacetylase [Planctomycetes bacterium]|nr:O-acetyl-ADP-ribose deacetylase [Planctomycetota bacterium]